MILLISSIVALAVGPLIYRMARKRDLMLSLLDGFIFVTISGLVLLFILPESFVLGGWWTIVFAVSGLFGPTALERIFRRTAKQTHIAALVLGLAGICLHGLIDGTALVPQQSYHSKETGLLPFAVILHRFPVGLTIWWLLRPAFGIRTAVSVLGLVSLATVSGFALGPYLTIGLSSQGIAWFQALVAGSLLHVIFHQPHLDKNSCSCERPGSRNSWFEGAGAVFGILLMVILVSGGFQLEGNDLVHRSASVFVSLALKIAPALLIAYLVAGLMNAFLPHSSISWMRRGSRWQQSLKGMAVGLPFPICSCGVVPLYQTLIQKGAPPAAAMAFLIATPELGLDAILVSFPLLGPDMALLRIFSAALVAVLVGRIVGGMLSGSSDESPDRELAEEDPVRQRLRAVDKRLWTGLKVGLGEVVDYTAPWILLGLCTASVAQPMLEGGWLARIPDYWEVPLFALLGLPTYVCASGATPLVAVLLFSGVSPGAAMAFLLTGPATNVTTFGLLGKLHGRRAAIVFSLTIMGLSVGLGYLVNAVFPGIARVSLEELRGDEPSILNVISLVLVGGTYLSSLLRRGARRFVGELFLQDERAIDLTPHYH